jgi:hypothetical protein
MVQPSAITTFEDAALDEARPLSRGPRMDPQLSQQLRTRLQSLSDQAVRMTIPNGTSPTAMKSRILRVAAELGLPMTIRRVSSGLLLWRSSNADMHHAREIANRLQTAQRRRQRRQGTRRRGSRGTPITRGDREGGDQMIHLSCHRLTHSTPLQTAVFCGVRSMLHIVWQF